MAFGVAPRYKKRSRHLMPVKEVQEMRGHLGVRPIIKSQGYSRSPGPPANDGKEETQARQERRDQTGQAEQCQRHEGRSDAEGEQDQCHLYSTQSDHMRPGQRADCGHVGYDTITIISSDHDGTTRWREAVSYLDNINAYLFRSAVCVDWSPLPTQAVLSHSQGLILLALRHAQHEEVAS